MTEERVLQIHFLSPPSLFQRKIERIDFESKILEWLRESLINNKPEALGGFNFFFLLDLNSKTKLNPFDPQNWKIRPRLCCTPPPRLCSTAGLHHSASNSFRIAPPSVLSLNWNFRAQLLANAQAAAANENNKKQVYVNVNELVVVKRYEAPKPVQKKVVNIKLKPKEIIEISPDTGRLD